MGVSLMPKGDYIHSSGTLGKTPQEPLILAIETSSRIGSAALALGSDLLEVSAFSAPLQHSSEIFPIVDALLSRHGHTPSDIRQIHISIGPGSFTGLRIAVTIAKTMHLANAARIITVDSLDVVAANLHHALAKPTTSSPDERRADTPDRIAVLFDAKRGQFYAAVYERVASGDDASGDVGYRIGAPGNTLWRKTVADRLMTAREIVDGFVGPNGLGLLGDGLLYHRDEFDTPGVSVLPQAFWSPSAAGVHLLGCQKAHAGRFADPLALIPFYLRGPQVTLKRNL